MANPVLKMLLAEQRNLLLSAPLLTKDDIKNELLRYLGIKETIIDGKIKELDAHLTARLEYLINEYRQLRNKNDIEGVNKVKQFIAKYEEHLYSAKGDEALTLVGLYQK